MRNSSCSKRLKRAAVTGPAPGARAAARASSELCRARADRCSITDPYLEKSDRRRYSESIMLSKTTSERLTFSTTSSAFTRLHRTSSEIISRVYFKTSEGSKVSHGFPPNVIKHRGRGDLIKRNDGRQNEKYARKNVVRFQVTIVLILTQRHQLLTIVPRRCLYHQSCIFYVLFFFLLQFTTSR